MKGLAAWRFGVIFCKNWLEATGCGIFVYSRRGYGRSDPKPLPWPTDFMTRKAIDVLPGILDAIGVQQVVLFGHSDGAAIAAIYAGSVEDFRIRGLIPMAMHFFTEPSGLVDIARDRFGRMIFMRVWQSIVTIPTSHSEARPRRGSRPNSPIGMSPKPLIIL